MNKKIILALFVITTTFSHGMKRPANIFQNDDATNNALMLFNPDLLSRITAQICSRHKYHPDKIKKDIRTLSLTNRSFHDYYAQEKVKQVIIDLCLPHHNSNSKDIAHDLGCRAIHDKIENLTIIVRDDKKEFSPDDLADAWYLSATTTYSSDYNIYQEPVNQSLLFIAIDYWGLNKAITILDNTKELNFDYSFEQNPLLRVAEQRARLLNPSSDLLSYESFKGFLELLFTIAEKLLQKNILPDGRTENNPHTPLRYAVQHVDKKLVILLLQYKANPYLIGHNFSLDKDVNAFDLEPEPGWLQNIIDEVNAYKNNHNK